MLKRLALIALLAVAMTLLFSGVAYANFGPHGGYEKDTDSCAGCHRAHTSFSPIEWSDQFGTTHTALLVSSATTMKEFCNACHGDDAPGASTNVVSGVFDAGPSGADTQVEGDLNGGVQVAYETNSTFNHGLNGGGFEQMPDPYSEAGAVYGDFKTSTSLHDMDLFGNTDPMWGKGSSVPTKANITCTDCHDPHGSSNYRLLKGSVNGHTVGGYDAGDNPIPFVISAEEGYPASGWLKHQPGATQMAAYYPNYTDPEYAWQAPSSPGSPRSMSTWCAACHEQYDDRATNYDYGGYEAYDVTPRANAGDVLTPGSGTDVGDQLRHRHPVNISLAAGVGINRALQEEVITDAFLPLEARPGSPNSRGVWDVQDYLGCLTCHRAHGTSADMTGWAEARLDYSATRTTQWIPERLTQATTSGVNPNFTSALLRTDNRGVCERCHNK